MSTATVREELTTLATIGRSGWPLAPTPAALSARWRRAGLHTDATLPGLLGFNATYRASLPAVFDDDVVLTWAELAQRAASVASSLSSAGVSAGDVVLWQLPNWWECFVVTHATWLLGAVTNPVLTVNGPHELRHIVAQTRPAAVVAPVEFRGRHNAADIDSVCADVGHQPAARIVVRGGRAGWSAFDDCLERPPFVHDGAFPAPDLPALVAFTSGTTGVPKGVVHSTQTFLASALANVRCRDATSADRNYIPSPMAHASGVSRGLGIPLVSGAAVVLRERWDPELAVDDIERYGVTVLGGAVVFLQEFVEALDRRGIDRFELAKGFGTGGSSAPLAVLERAEEIGLHPSRAYGMTECINASFALAGATVEQRHFTDGHLAPGVEVNVVDGGGRPLGCGEPGELLVRGPQRALGYIDRAATEEAFDADGWFRTGDIGRLTSHGHVEVTGRLKDIVNRGGFKFATREVEELLAAYPGVVDAVVVAIPHHRFGEQAAAVLRVGDAADVSENALVAHLERYGLAHQKFPMVWRFVTELPRTASGKIKKHELVATLRSELAESTGE